MKKLLLLLMFLCLLGCQKDIEIGSIDNSNDYYGILIIPSINMTYGFYDLESDRNDVSKNVTLIDSGIPNTYILAAHSGTGSIAYFNDLKFVEQNDEIYLKFKDKTNVYEVKSIRSEKKNGTINIKREENQVILTTCDQVRKGNQLIIEASLKS